MFDYSSFYESLNRYIMIEWALIVSLLVLMFAIEKRKKDFKLEYYIATRNMISDEHGIIIKFCDKPCNRLSRTRIIINNLGNCNIHEKDFAGNGIEISTNTNNEILLSKIIRGEELVNMISNNDNSLSFKLKRLAPNKEIIIDIYHTGVNNIDINLDCAFDDDNHQIERNEYITTLAKGSLKISSQTALKALYLTIIIIFLLKITGIFVTMNSFLETYVGNVSSYLEIGVLSVIVYVSSFTYLNLKYWSNLKYVRDL